MEVSDQVATINFFYITQAEFIKAERLNVFQYEGMKEQANQKVEPYEKQLQNPYHRCK